MARKYYSSSNQTSHTYSFYKNRRDDPKWQGDYLRIKAIKQRNTFIMINRQQTLQIAIQELWHHFWGTFFASSLFSVL